MREQGTARAGLDKADISNMPIGVTILIKLMFPVSVCYRRIAAFTRDTELKGKW
jgi:hypothetical protein